MRQKALLIDADDAASIPSPPAIRPDRIVAFLNLEAACRSEIIERVEAIGPDEVVLCDLYPEAVDLALLAWRQEYESRFDCELATKDEALKYAFAKDVFPDGWNWRAALDGPGMTTMSWP